MLDFNCYNKKCETYDKDRPLSCSHHWHHGPSQCDFFLTFCPFCTDGGSPGIKDISAIRTAFCIRCLDCYTFKGGYQPDRHATKKGACESWNRRKI